MFFPGSKPELPAPVAEEPAQPASAVSEPAKEAVAAPEPVSEPPAAVEEPAAPCGNCRQSMIEYEQKQKSAIAILLMGEKGEVIKIKSLADILPLAFSNSFLE